MELEFLFPIVVSVWCAYLTPWNLENFGPKAKEEEEMGAQMKPDMILEFLAHP